jgi:hypothetical protein
VRARSSNRLEAEGKAQRAAEAVLTLSAIHRAGWPTVKSAAEGLLLRRVWKNVQMQGARIPEE